MKYLSSVFLLVAIAMIMGAAGNTKKTEETFRLLTTPEWWEVASVKSIKDNADVTSRFRNYFTKYMKFIAKDSTLTFKTVDAQFSAGHFVLSPNARKICLESRDTMEILSINERQLVLKVLLDKKNPKDKKPAELVMKAEKKSDRE